MDTRTSPIVSVDWLAARTGEPGLVIADVRSADAYRAGHIPGAIHADLSALRLGSSSPEAIAGWTASLQTMVDSLGLGPDRTVVFHEDVSGTMAAYGVWLLDAAGFRNGAMLDGGLLAWQRSGHPVSTDLVRPVPASGPIQPDQSVLATADQILASLDGPESAINVVDTRGIHEFAMGSIPGAISVDWVRNLDGDGRFKPMDELATMYADAGLDRSAPVASYCAAGFRAANTYVVLKALGYASAQNYAPSWGEWGQRADTPVERPRRG